MNTQQVEELKDSYYEYLAKVPQGLTIIVARLAESNLSEAYTDVANLAEGLEALLLVEQALLQENFVINSRIVEAMNIFEQVNDSLEHQQNEELQQIVQLQLFPIFESASEWQFTIKE